MNLYDNINVNTWEFMKYKKLVKMFDPMLKRRDNFILVNSSD